MVMAIIDSDTHIKLFTVYKCHVQFVNLSLVNSQSNQIRGTLDLINCNLSSSNWRNFGNLTVFESNFTNSSLSNYGNLNVSNSSFQMKSFIINDKPSNLTVDGCIFKGDVRPIRFLQNYSATNSKSYINNSKFFNNSLSAISSSYYAVFIENCTFENNRGSDGGAILSSQSNLNIKNCSFINNSASGNGGAIFSGSCVPSITYSNFSINSANGLGDSIFSNGNLSIYKNNILWKNLKRFN